MDLITVDLHIIKQKIVKRENLEFHGSDTDENLSNISKYMLTQRGVINTEYCTIKQLRSNLIANGHHCLKTNWTTDFADVISTYAVYLDSNKNGFQKWAADDYTDIIKFLMSDIRELKLKQLIEK